MTFSNQISRNISKQVLTLGPEYVNFRGGIGGLMSKYLNKFEVFNFISTYREQPNKAYVILYFMKCCVKLTLSLLRSPEIKIVHIHVATKGSFYRKYILFVLCKSIFRKKVIYHSHASEFVAFYENSSTLGKLFIRHFVESADVFICLSKQWKNYYGTKFKIKSLVILNNIVDKSTIHKGDVSYQPLPIKFLFLGVIGYRKGVFDILSVIQMNRELLRGKMHLTVGGNGETERIKNFIAEHQLSDIVNFVGWVSGGQKIRLLNQSDVYILPSYNEGLPLSILEAMAYKLPVISTPVGGTPEVVKTGVNGFLIQPGSLDLILEKIMFFVDNPSAIDQMGSASLEIVAPYYSENVIPKLENLYSELLAN